MMDIYYIIYTQSEMFSHNNTNLLADGQIWSAENEDNLKKLMAN